VGGGGGTEETEVVHNITSKRLPQDNQALAIVDEESPNRERNFKVKTDVLAPLRCYSKILGGGGRKYGSLHRSLHSLKQQWKCNTSSSAVDLWPHISSAAILCECKTVQLPLSPPQSTFSTDPDEPLPLQQP
jgi:hypothetical protein